MHLRSIRPKSRRPSNPDELNDSPHKLWVRLRGLVIAGLINHYRRVMGESERIQSGGKGRRRRSHMVRIVWLASILVIVFVLTLSLILRRPRSFYWSARKYSLSTQSLSPGGPFADEGWWVHSGWDVPSPNDFRHGKMYGLKLGKRLIRLDILDDPIAAIRRNLPHTTPGLIVGAGVDGVAQ